MIERLGIRLYDSAEAAVILGVTPRTIRQMRNDGRLAQTKIGRKSYITEETLRDYLLHGATKKEKGGSR